MLLQLERPHQKLLQLSNVRQYHCRGVTVGDINHFLQQHQRPQDRFSYPFRVLISKRLQDLLQKGQV